MNPEPKTIWSKANNAALLIMSLPLILLVFIAMTCAALVAISEGIIKRIHKHTRSSINGEKHQQDDKE